MPYSQIEIASSSPFGCVLKDHNSRRDKTESNQTPNPKSQSNFQKNLKELVRGHFHSCIPITSPRHCLKSKEKHNSNNSNYNGQEGEEVMALSSMPSSACSSMRERDREGCPSPTDSDASSADNFSVSSLVQKWREAEARNGRTIAAQPLSPNGEPSPSRANSVVSESASTIVEERQGNMNNGDEDECQSFDDNNNNNKPRQLHEADSGDVAVDGGERESIRVADIVRKWAQSSGQAAVCDEGSSNHNQQLQQTPFGSLTRLTIGVGNGSGGGGGSIFACPMLCSPRIRGRQAVADLFMRMEKERYKEVHVLASRHVVSKFPQRGRIQSVLKFGFLRRDALLREEERPLLSPRLSDNQRRQPASRWRPPLPRPVESNKEQTVGSSTITSLREKFDTATEQDSTNNATISTQGDDIKSIQEGEDTSSSNSNQLTEHITANQGLLDIQSCTTKASPINHCVKITVKESQQTCPKEDLNITTHASKTTNNNVDVQMTVSDSQQEENSSELQLHTREDESAQNNMVNQAIEQLHEHIWGDNNYNEGGILNLQKQDSAVMSYNSWEEEEEEEEENLEEPSSPGLLEEPNLDWISDIARPRSYWEDRRLAWYQEVFTTRSQDEEIRQLLERGSVASVLASDFRNRMDRLVMCNVQRAMHPIGNEEREEGQTMVACLERRLPSFDNRSSSGEERQLVLQEEHVQEHMEDVEQEDKEDKEEGEEQNVVDENEEDDDDDDDDADNFYDPTPSPTQFQWDHFRDQEVSDDSDNAPSTSLQQPSPLPSLDRETRESSPFKNSSIEMELIYDMRAHMEQLYQEMSELRKSVATCMEMQIKMQHSIKEEVSVAFNNPKKREKANDSNRKRPKKGNCCICYEKKVDSLLYRCGHMCTCFNCAYELQWSSGKCPICRAQIIDVVRAYPDN